MYYSSMLNYNTASLTSKIRDNVNNLIVTELNKEGIKGIVPSHGDILVCLYHVDGLSVKEIAERINRTQPTTTVLIDKLQVRGYISRIKSKEDSRVSLIYLTEEGKKLEPIFREISNKLNNIIYGSLENDEKEQLEYLLEKILKRF